MGKDKSRFMTGSGGSPGETMHVPTRTRRTSLPSSVAPKGSDTIPAIPVRARAPGVITDEIPNDRAPETIKETITYHTCRLADLDQSCAYPARYYKFKEELEQFTSWARETILRNA